MKIYIPRDYPFRRKVSPLCQGYGPTIWMLIFLDDV